MSKQFKWFLGLDKISFEACLSLRVLPILILILTATGPISGQEGYQYKVKGRAVDEHGRPVARAYVVVDAGLPSTWEDSWYWVESDQSGHFLFYDGKEDTADHKRFLYVTGPLPTNAVSLVTPPFNRNRELTGKIFASRSIWIKENAEVDLGDVPIQVRYGVIHVRLQDSRGQPLIKNAENWRMVWLRVRSDEGKVVSSGGLSINEIEKGVNLKESSVDISLPEGTWFIDSSPNEDKGPWLTSSAPVTVKAAAKAMLTLKLR